MANISQYLTKAMLDWTLQGANPTRPAAFGIGLSQGSPTSISGSEIGVTSNYSRLTAGAASNSCFSAAGTPTSSGTTMNISNLTFGPLSAATISGLQIWDTVLSNNSGNMLYYGLLTTARTLVAGDSLVIASNALTVALN